MISFLLKLLILFSVIFSTNSISAQDSIESSIEIDEIIVTGSRIKGANTDSFANDFDPSYRTWGSQQWYVRASSKF